jgi:hypothetical protein
MAQNLVEAAPSGAGAPAELVEITPAKIAEAESDVREMLDAYTGNSRVGSRSEARAIVRATLRAVGISAQSLR